jgi:putative Mg2+ transporter-C (MgtC) family protein
MVHPIFFLDTVITVLLGSLLGGLIGIEREMHGRPAGFRTHLLVSLGAALFVAVSISFHKVYGNFSGVVPVGVDPGRVAAQVVTGIGFLGAGASIRERWAFRGLTTAACLWVAAAVGLACGAGLFTVSLVATAIALISLLVLKQIEGVMNKDSYHQVMVVSNDLPGQFDRIEQIVKDCGASLMETALERQLDTATIRFEFRMRIATRNASCRLFDLLSAVEGVQKVSLR